MTGMSPVRWLLGSESAVLLCNRKHNSVSSLSIQCDWHIRESNRPKAKVRGVGHISVICFMSWCFDVCSVYVLMSDILTDWALSSDSKVSGWFETARGSHSIATIPSFRNIFGNEIDINALLACHSILYWSWWPRLFVGTPGTRTTWWWTRRCKPSRAASMKNLRRCSRGGRIENHFHFLNHLRCQQQRSFLVMFDTLI